MLTFETLSREMLEAELNRCNQIMVDDGKRIAELRAKQETTWRNYLDTVASLDKMKMERDAVVVCCEALLAWVDKDQTNWNDVRGLIAKIKSQP